MKPQLAGNIELSDTMTRVYHIGSRGIIYLGAVAIIFFIIYSSRSAFGFIGKTHDTVKNHWIIKFFHHPLDYSVTLFRNLFNVFMNPFIEFFENIMHVLADMVKNIQNIRLMINYLRDSLRTILLDIAGMFYGYAKKLSFLFERFKTSFFLLTKVFDDIYTGMLYLISVFYDGTNTIKPLFSIVDPIAGLVNGIASFF